MGPYYLTALVQLLGPARRISAMGAHRACAAARSRRSRSPGEMIDVEVPTHVSSAIEFASGPIATLVTSFDVQASRYRCIEVYGTEATLSVPDPNTFGGPVTIRRHGDEEWTEVELLDAAPAAVPRHRLRRHDLGAAHRPRAPRVGRARAPRARAHDRPRSRRPEQGRRRRARRRRASARAPLPVGLPENTYDD